RGRSEARSRPVSGDRLGGDQVEGRRAVAELLRARRRPVRTVYVSSAAATDRAVAEIVELGEKRVRIVAPEKLEQIARSDTHQGVVAQAAPLRPAAPDDLLASPAAFGVALDGVTDPRNFGAIIRSADTAGATGIVVARHRAAHVTPAVTKAAAGAVEHLP